MGIVSITVKTDDKKGGTAPVVVYPSGEMKPLSDVLNNHTQWILTRQHKRRRAIAGENS